MILLQITTFELPTTLRRVPAGTCPVVPCQSERLQGLGRWTNIALRRLRSRRLHPRLGYKPATSCPAHFGPGAPRRMRCIGRRSWSGRGRRAGMQGSRFDRVYRIPQRFGRLTFCHERFMLIFWSLKRWW